MSELSTDRAEIAVASAVFFDNGLLEECGALNAGHFSDAMLGALYAAVTERIGKAEVATPATLQGWAKTAGIEFQVLVNLYRRGEQEIAHVGAHAKAVIDGARRRALALALTKARKHVIDNPSADPTDLYAEAEKLLRAVEAGGETTVTLRSAGALAVANAAKGERGIKTGFATLDRLIGGLYAPDLMILAGRPSMGKTSLATNIGHSAALRDYVVHMASQEMSAEQIAQRALSRSSYPSERDRFQYRSFRRGGVPIDTASSLVQRLPECFEIDDAGGQTLAHLQASLRATRRKHGRLDLVIVDYLQLMRDDAIRRGETAEITALTKGLKQIAKDMHVPILCLSQLSREVEKRPDKRPQLADLRQSGSIEQDADVVLFAFREHYYLSRAKPVPEDNESNIDFDVRYHKWADRCEETSGRMEVIASKTRMDETGSDYLLVDLAFDIATDPPAETPPTSIYQR